MTSMPEANPAWRSGVSLAACLVLVGLSACASETEGGSTASAAGLSLQSTLPAAPAEASEVLVAWNVSSGPEDYAYIWGRAAVTDDSFKLNLPNPPPAEAINSYGLGVGLLVVMPVAAGVPDGRQSESDEDKFEQVTGASERHAIIYVDRERAEAEISAASPDEVAEAREHWLFDFEAGYSCGVGKEAAPGETFDSYQPIGCDAVQIRMGNGEFDFPDWT